MNNNSCQYAPTLKYWMGRLLTQKPTKYTVMKLTIILIVLHLQVSAKAYSQFVTLRVTNAPLTKVLHEIGVQTGYSFVYTPAVMKSAKPVTVTLNNVSIENALKQIFSTQLLDFALEDAGIAIFLKSKAVATEEAKPKDIPIPVKGRVKDKDGHPLPGVTIKVKGSSTGTITAADGTFLITAEPNAYLLFSMIGYKIQEIQVNARSNIDLVLQEVAAELQEMVVKGYYTTSKLANTGNVSTVKGETLGRQVTSDPITALTGQVSGLSVIPLSGIPGSALTVRLRGQNSIANGNDPLYIVDGVPYVSSSLYDGLKLGMQANQNASPFGALRLTDIESIDVLKDADATAIYGSRGANGVILITTKKGKVGKTRLNVNMYQGAGKVVNTAKLMNTQEYLTMRNQAYKNDGTKPGPFDYDVNGTWDQTRYTDWQKVMIGNTAKVTDGQVSLSGGSNLTQFRIAGGYRKEGSVFAGDYYDQKGSGQVNINHQTENNRFHVNLNLSFVRDQNKMPLSDFTRNILWAPNTPAIYNPDGSLNWEKGTWNNPLWQTRLSNTATTTNLNTGLNFDYTIYKELKFSTRLGYNNVRLNYANLNPISDNPYVTQYPGNRRNNFGNKQIETWIVEPTFSYAKTIGPGKLETLIGSTFQQSMSRGISQTASGFTSNEQIVNVAAAANVKISATVADKYRYSALYARMGYTIDDKYILNLTGRRDASSRFGPDNQIGNFGAAGAAWVFSKESFLNLPFLSFGKLRGSYGITGNDQLESYKYLSTYSPYPLLNFQGNPILVATQLTNPTYGWESVKKLETALELGFFKDRIRLNTSWYRHRTGNQLVGYNLPVITGFPTVTANLPAVLQNSGLEFDLSTRNLETENFTWTTSFNISIPKNKLVSYPGIESSSYAYTYVVGRPLSLQFLYHYTGLDKNKDTYTFEDVNQDGQITYDQDRKGTFIGQKYFGGFTNSITYKNFSLDIFISFAKQNGYDITTLAAPGIYIPEASNQKASLLDQVQRQEIQPFTAGLGTSVSGKYATYQASDAFLVDASYIRLKNVSLSWTLPDKFQKAVKLANARIYLQAQNLLTISPYKGIDPEFFPPGGPTNLILPSMRMFTAGIDLSF